MGLLLLGLLLSLATGALVVLVLNWSLISGYRGETPSVAAPRGAAADPQSDPTTPAATPILVVAQPPLPTLGLAQPPIPRLPTLAPIVATPAPTVLAPIPTLSPAPELAAAEPTPLTPDAAWQLVVPELDAAWGQDAAGTVRILDAFRTRFPDYEPARDKLYAALLASAADMAEQGQSSAAADQLTRATQLLPVRPEAAAALQALTPTPVPATLADQQVTDQQAGAAAPTPARVVAQANAGRPPVATPVRQAPPPAPVAPVFTPTKVPVVRIVPTPTKVPFRPPSGP